MKLREYLEQAGDNDDYTFIISKAVPNAHGNGYHAEYYQTPIRRAWEWMSSGAPDKYIMVKTSHPPIDLTGTWSRWYKNGRIRCCIITTEEAVHAIHPWEEQALETLEKYDRKARSAE